MFFNTNCLHPPTSKILKIIVLIMITVYSKRLFLKLYIINLIKKIFAKLSLSVISNFTACTTENFLLLLKEYIINPKFWYS